MARACFSTYVLHCDPGSNILNINFTVMDTQVDPDEDSDPPIPDEETENSG